MLVFALKCSAAHHLLDIARLTVSKFRTKTKLNFEKTPKKESVLRGGGDVAKRLFVYYSPSLGSRKFV